MTKSQRADRIFVPALSLGLILYSSVVHLIPGFNLLYVPLGLVTTAALLILGRRSSLTAVDIGLDRATMRPGLKLGLGVAVVAAICLLIAVAIPPLHPLFEDARVADYGPALVAYRALIRIPLGTAVLEEFAFRGVLFGAWQRWSGTKAAVIGSSVVFGLWHIRPAIDLVNANELSSAVGVQAGVVLASVVMTAVAGVFFALLRIRSRSLLAPLLAHGAINSLALVAAAIVASNG